MRKTTLDTTSFDAPPVAVRVRTTDVVHDSSPGWPA